MAQAGLDFIRNNVSINSIITGGAVWGEVGQLGLHVVEAGCRVPEGRLHVRGLLSQMAFRCTPPWPHTALPLPPCSPDRVDRLRPEEQLTLKVASILGLTIYRQLLQARLRSHACCHG